MGFVSSLLSHFAHFILSCTLFLHRLFAGPHMPALQGWTSSMETPLSGTLGCQLGCCGPGTWHRPTTEMLPTGEVWRSRPHQLYLKRFQIMFSLLLPQVGEPYTPLTVTPLSRMQKTQNTEAVNIEFFLELVNSRFLYVRKNPLPW